MKTAYSEERDVTFTEQQLLSDLHETAQGLVKLIETRASEDGVELKSHEELYGYSEQYTFWHNNLEEPIGHLSEMVELLNNAK